MGKWASGKYALGISDRSGAAYPLRNMRKEWTGMLVGWDEWEAKQPQLNPLRAPADAQALRDSRPDRAAPAVTVLLQFNPFRSGSSGSSVITVTEPGNDKSTGDTVRFRSTENFDGFTSSALEDADGYSITIVTESDGSASTSRYTFDISSSGSSETSSTGNVPGGGGTASAGPLTVSP
jgi:hypothetical protein|tara:strand:+ start:920 stop:1456 length:537 start_codon:yes stop_codon:yes gene_type:complete